MSDFISSGWSWYVIGIVVFGLVYCAVVLFGAARHKVVYDENGNVDKTTGHVWDGDLRELNNPLPRWWMFLFIITLIFSVAYLALYPGFGASKGTLNWSSVGQYEAEMAKAQEAQEATYAAFRDLPVPELAKDTTAQAIGERLFLNNCAACHGSDAKGAKGFPNLTDTDWLHGGSPEQIHETILKGRVGLMPPQAEAVGSSEEVRQVAHYVLSLSGSGHNSILAQLGQAKYKQVCAACHAADGKGNTALGAPNLTDKVWLHGWGEQMIIDSINHGRTGTMPAQEGRLSEDQIKVLTSYVWGLSNVKAAEAAAAQ